ncbi:unnamed protein product [Ascophyllum nodosum]
MVACAFGASCDKVARFAATGTEEPEFCFEHAYAGMVNVTSKRRSRKPFARTASPSDVAGSRDLSTEDTVGDTARKPGGSADCSNTPTHETPGGSEKREFCAEYTIDGARAGVVNVTSEAASPSDISGGRKEDPGTERTASSAVDMPDGRCSSAGFSKPPRYEMPDSSKKRKICAEHAVDGARARLVDVKSKPVSPSDVAGSRGGDPNADHSVGIAVNVSDGRCSRTGCSKTPTHGSPGSEKREFCARHAVYGMVNVSVNRQCGRVGCLKIPTHRKPGRKRKQFCEEHAVDGMISAFHNQRCSWAGCSKGSLYGMPSTKKREFCAEHAVDGMVNMVHKRCSSAGCPKISSYGMPSDRKREFCVEHMVDGMINLSVRQCAHVSCIKFPTYGVPGSQRPEFCVTHAADGMINLSSRRCSRQGCSKIPSYGMPGSKKREVCARHMVYGMVNMTLKRCAQRGCSKIPSDGMVGSKRAKFCLEHEAEGLMRLPLRKVPGGKRSWKAGQKARSPSEPAGAVSKVEVVKLEVTMSV